MKVKNIKKIISTIIIIQILLISIIPTISSAINNDISTTNSTEGSNAPVENDKEVVVETKLGSITIKYPSKALNIGEEANIEIYAGETSIINAYMQIQYDKDILEMGDLAQAITVAEGWTVAENGEVEFGREIRLDSNGITYALSNTLVATIKCKVKDIKEKTTDFNINQIVIADTTYEDSLDEEGYGVSQTVTLNLNKIDKPVDPDPVDPDPIDPDPVDPDDPIDQDKPLYLSSRPYKIGNEDLDNYQEGDKYISRVEKETTKQEFIKNLKTNGKIRILKTDGTELEDDELVGTGMTLEVTKDKEKIELQIAVMGDLDGNGKITATDLSALNQVVLKIITLENEYYIAADLDENEKISASDLSTENSIVLGIIDKLYNNDDNNNNN